MHEYPRTEIDTRHQLNYQVIYESEYTELN